MIEKENRKGKSIKDAGVGHHIGTSLDLEGPSGEPEEMCL